MREWNRKGQSGSFATLRELRGAVSWTRGEATSPHRKDCIERRKCWACPMRIRITKARSGLIDGVNLAVFHEGHSYEVDQSIASYLIVTGTAEPALEEHPALVVRGLGSEVLVAVTPELRPDLAPDADGSDDPESAA